MTNRGYKTTSPVLVPTSKITNFISRTEAAQFLPTIYIVISKIAHLRGDKIGAAADVGKASFMPVA